MPQSTVGGGYLLLLIYIIYNTVTFVAEDRYSVGFSLNNAGALVSYSETSKLHRHVSEGKGKVF